ncbi:sulfite exporter TauE/SafE family protein [Agaribacter flavus]|uniref:Probable membrane transporter protein n=1 Tax=Agaribacter flavus TaxID=1902781 RepID=A0ABV7FVY4_9ALTE
MTQLIQHINLHKIKLSIFLLWLLVLFMQADLSQLLMEYAGFLILGIAGAVFANSTGAGGGVVFVPFFNQIGLDNMTIVATSFGIQCCGMTAGAITWWKHYRSSHLQDEQWQDLGKALKYSVLPSIIGIVFAQYLLHDFGSHVAEALHLYFGLFSILLACCIYMSVPLLNRQTIRSKIILIDSTLLVVIAMTGGVITAWLSVGVGELIAVYLILRGFNVTFSIAVAVILSAFSVWGGVYYHVSASQAIYWDIVLFAGAGAVIGGLVAKYLVLFFSPVRLKIFFATWIMIMGVAGLPIW